MRRKEETLERIRNKLIKYLRKPKTMAQIQNHLVYATRHSVHARFRELREQGYKISATIQRPVKYHIEQGT